MGCVSVFGISDAFSWFLGDCGDRFPVLLVSTSKGWFQELLKPAGWSRPWAFSKHMGNDEWEVQKISFVQTIFWHLKVQAARESFILIVEKCLWFNYRGKILCRMPESRQGLSPQQLQQWQESSSTWVKLETRFLAAFVWLCDECLFKGSLKHMTLKSFKHTTVFSLFSQTFQPCLGFCFLRGTFIHVSIANTVRAWGFIRNLLPPQSVRSLFWSGQTRWIVTNTYVIISCECGDDAITHITLEYDSWLDEWMVYC